MSYEPQPGTIPFRAHMWLRSMAKVSPGKEPTTVEICDGLGIENNGFTAYMRPAREHGLVHARKSPVANVLHWKLGDGTPDPSLLLRGRDVPLKGTQLVHEEPEAAPVLSRREKKQVQAQRASFRAMVWEGQLLATGMQMIDGVAVFSPEQIGEIKRLVTWAVPA